MYLDLFAGYMMLEADLGVSKRMSSVSRVMVLVSLHTIPAGPSS